MPFRTPLQSIGPLSCVDSEMNLKIWVPTEALPTTVTLIWLLLGVISDVSANRSSSWSPYHTLGTCEAFPLCELSDECAELSCRRKPSCTHHICRLSPPCAPSSECAGVCFGWSSSHPRHTCKAFSPCAASGELGEWSWNWRICRTLPCVALWWTRRLELWSSPPHTWCTYTAFSHCGPSDGNTGATQTSNPFPHTSQV